MDNCRLRICPVVLGYPQALGKRQEHFLALKILMGVHVTSVGLCRMGRMEVLAEQKIRTGKHSNQGKTGGVVSIQAEVRSRRSRRIRVTEVVGGVAVAVALEDEIHLTETKCLSSNKGEILFETKKNWINHGQPTTF